MSVHLSVYEHPSRPLTACHGGPSVCEFPNVPPAFRSSRWDIYRAKRDSWATHSDFSVEFRTDHWTPTEQ